MILLQQKAMVVACTVTRNQVESMIHALADFEEQGEYICHDINDCRYTAEERSKMMSGYQSGHHVPDNVKSYEVKKGPRLVPELYCNAMIPSS
ncbi:hypothetical protein STEG23_027812 [Scotinomys teguina]